jgi:serine/threonine-protein kinase
VDFGVAKATALGDGATQAGQIKGKVGYMAPEQVKGDPIDRRVDVFALGIGLYALTTGKHPFRRESEAATMYNICAPQPVMPPSKVIPDYPADLEAVILKALAKDKDKRFASANDMLKALDGPPASSARPRTTKWELSCKAYSVHAGRNARRRWLTRWNARTKCKPKVAHGKPCTLPRKSR